MTVSGELCAVCEIVEKKYKCPACLIFYCSITCFKTHKENTCISVQPSGDDDDPRSTNTNQFPEEEAFLFSTDNTVPLEKLKLLSQSDKLKSLLTNKHLRDFLMFLDSSDDKARLMRKAMREPLFVEFVDTCLETLDPEMMNREVTDEELLQAIKEKAEEDVDD